MLFTLLTQEKCYLRSRSNVITTLTIWRARRKQNKVLSSRNIVISPKQTKWSHLFFFWSRGVGIAGGGFEHPPTLISSVWIVQISLGLWPGCHLVLAWHFLCLFFFIQDTFFIFNFNLSRTYIILVVSWFYKLSWKVNFLWSNTVYKEIINLSWENK